jgi:glucose-fructose oxidoreductase
VLCEKPLALSEAECREMIAAAGLKGVRLMTAYRLHFDSATLTAIDLVRRGRIGEPRFFSSTFSMQVTDLDNIRLKAERGGGPLLDLGVYCINAARALFQDEPIQVVGMHAAGADRRFVEVPEMTFAMLRFPGERVATFGASFGAAETSAYHIVGTLGDLRVEPAYEYAEGLAHRLTVSGRVTRRRFPKRDQFGAELLAFSAAILERRDPEPSGIEGLADVRVIEAIERSAFEGRAIELPPLRTSKRLTKRPEIKLPPVPKPEEVKVRSPHD